MGLLFLNCSLHERLDLVGCEGPRRDEVQDMALAPLHPKKATRQRKPNETVHAEVGLTIRVLLPDSHLGPRQC